MKRRSLFCLVLSLSLLFLCAAASAGDYLALPDPGAYFGVAPNESGGSDSIWMTYAFQTEEECDRAFEEYAALLDRAFGERWIDVYENRGKTTGAYSCGVYGVHPYVLLNYTDSLVDAFTLPHELRHAMHSYLSDRAQEYPNHDYRILVAEVASTVNEVLLSEYLLSVETDPHRRADAQ